MKTLFASGLILAIAGVGTASAQNVDEFIRLFGGLAQSAINKKAAAKEWARVPSEERKCIDQALLFKGGSVQNLIRGGIRPSDPRLSEIRSNCRNQSPQIDVAGQPDLSSEASSPYVVDGLALGDSVHFGSAAYRAYKCSPSDKFDGFIWCQRSGQEGQGKRRAYSSNSILHRPDGRTAYVNRYIRPAFLTESDAKEEIARISNKFGERARVQNMPAKAGLPQAVIAIWGQIELVEINQEAKSILAKGGSAGVGLLVDFLGDFHKSATMGLPVYRLSGGAGYVWNASFDRKGVGHLRLSAVDASALSGETRTAGFEGPEEVEGPEKIYDPFQMWGMNTEQQADADDKVQAQHSTSAPACNWPGCPGYPTAPAQPHVVTPSEEVQAAAEKVAAEKAAATAEKAAADKAAADRAAADFSAPLTDCDTYAADPSDKQRKAADKRRGPIDPKLAIPACTEAVSRYPREARFVYALGDAFDANKEYEKALEQYRKAAEENYLASVRSIGIYYEDGRGIAKDETQAVIWYRKAADLGDLSAQHLLGHMYREGRGVAKDEAQAVAWFRQAAEQGYAGAQFFLGRMYEDGRGIDKDDTQAVAWYRKAADQGYAAALNRLPESRCGSADTKQLVSKTAKENDLNLMTSLLNSSDQAKELPEDVAALGIILGKMGNIYGGNFNACNSQGLEVFSQFALQPSSAARCRDFLAKVKKDVGLATYEIDSIRTKDINGELDKVTCAGIMHVNLPGWGSIEQDITFTAEITTDRELYVTVFGLTDSAAGIGAVGN